MTKRLLVVWQGITKRIDGSDLLATIGLLLIAAGLWEVSRPAALAVPGAVLLWIAIPPRPPFWRG